MAQQSPIPDVDWLDTLIGAGVWSPNFSFTGVFQFFFSFPIFLYRIFCKI
jgi:hypothetical protein